MNTAVMNATVAVALTTVTGVGSFKNTPLAGPSPAWSLTNTNGTAFGPAAPVGKSTPESPGIYLAHPYTLQVLVPGRVDLAMVHGNAPDSTRDEAVHDPHIELTPRN